jgi:hypothetical protein
MKSNQNRNESKSKGRSKISMERIPIQSKSNVTFTKRSKGVIKKLHELTTLCGAKFVLYLENPSNQQEIVGASENLDTKKFIQTFTLFKSKKPKKPNASNRGTNRQDR